MRTEYSCIIIGRINGLNLNGLVSKVLKLKGQFLFDCLRVLFIFLTDCLGETFSLILGGTLRRVEPRDETRNGSEEDRPICTLTRPSSCYLVSTDASSW